MAGATACIYALNGTAQYGTLNGFQVAFIFICIGAIFDFCDGLVARMLNTVSAIGKELDSLSDCVTFGLAPSMMVYTMLEQHNPGCLCNYAAFLIAVFGAVRLAKFNIDTTQATSFKGMPIPANAIFWIGYVNFCIENGYTGAGTFIAIAALSYLMICNMPMFSFKMKSFGIKENFHRYLLVVLTIAFVVCFGVTGLFYTIVAYTILSLIKK